MPSPSAYIRPSFQMAPGTPCSAAYSSSMNACSVLPWRSAWVPERNASCGDAGRPERGGMVVSGAPGTAASGAALPSELPAASVPERPSALGAATVVPSGARLPSKLTAGDRPKAKPSRPMPTRSSDVRIARLLDRPAGMGHRARARGSHLLGVLPQISRGEFRRARLPCLGARLELSLAELDVERALDGVDGDDVAVAHMRDRPADGGLRTHMTNAEAAGRSREAPGGPEGRLAARALHGTARGGRH